MRTRGRKRRDLRGPAYTSNPAGSLGVDKPRPEFSYQDFYPDFNPDDQILQICVDADPEHTNAREPPGIPPDKSQHKEVPPGVRYIENQTFKDFYVDRSMAAMGYQETDEFEMPEEYIRSKPVYLNTVLDNDIKPNPNDRNMLGVNGIRVEYDMDIQDREFLRRLNEKRVNELSVPEITPEMFEITMTLIETEWFKLEKLMPSKRKTSVLGELSDNNDDQRCSICDEAECDNSNAIVFCDGCDVAVHQECYGVPFIPEGQWLCRQCAISRRKRASCVFCPNKSGALKQTDTQHWAHMLCALWIPEVTIQNTAFLEPITGLDRIPKGRWKLNCYICKQKVGACIQCAQKNCYQSFHPTCARKARLCLKMSAGVQGGLYDPRTLMAFCDKHTPEDHAEAVDVQSYLKEAKDHYAKILAQQKTAEPNYNEINIVRETKIVRVKKPGAIEWKTDQGTPAIPNITVQKIVNMLSKFSIQKLKEYVWELARYWTCKKQYKRGATLTKRLQLALEILPTENHTKQSLAAKLEAYQVALTSLESLRVLMGDIHKREQLKFQLTETYLRIVDLTLFPISVIITPFWEKVSEICEKTNLPNLSTAAEIDSEGSRRGGLSYRNLKNRVEAKYYDSIGSCDAFLEDVELVFSNNNKLYEHGSQEYRAAERVLRLLKTHSDAIQKSFESLQFKGPGILDTVKVLIPQQQQQRRPKPAVVHQPVKRNLRKFAEINESGITKVATSKSEVKKRRLRSNI